VRWWPTKKVAEGWQWTASIWAVGFVGKRCGFLRIDVECFLPLDVVFDTCS
jgi:hypothetical protein